MSDSSSHKITDKAFWKSRRGQMVFCAAGLLVSVLFLLWQFGCSVDTILPNDSSRSKLERELKKLEADKKELEDELAIQDAMRKIAEKKFDGAWKSSVNGVPEVELRSLIENSARKMELRLNNISTVRKSNFNKDIVLLEVDVALTSDIDTLMKFLLEVRSIKPDLYWKRFECRMSNMFGMPGVNFNGTLRCICDERKPVEKIPQGGNK